jgi:hypothetical protein
MGMEKWKLRKSFNANNLIFQTVEDGFDRPYALASKELGAAGAM